MQEYHTNRSSSHPRRRGLIAAMLAVVLLGSVGFAAAGGVEMVKGWFMNVTVSVDGEVIASEDIVLDEDGTGTIVLPPNAVDGAEELTFTVESAETGEPIDGEGTATINISMEDNVTQLQVEIEQNDAEKDE